MPAENPTLLEWLTENWRTPLWQRAIRLAAAGLSAGIGILALLIAFDTGNWIIFLGAAFFFLIWGLRVEVPDRPLPVYPAEPLPPAAPEPPAGGAAGASEGAGKVTGATFMILHYLRLPLAVLSALAAQWILDQRPNVADIDANLPLGLFFYGVAFLFAAWSVLAGDFSLPVSVQSVNASETKFSKQRILLVVGALVFGVLAYGTLTGGMYNVFSLLLLALALFYWILAVAEYSGTLFDAIRTAAGSIGRRFRSLAETARRGITLSPWSLWSSPVFSSWSPTGPTISPPYRPE